MPSNNVFQYSKIRTRSAKKSIKTGKRMESSSFWNPESTVLESGIQYPESGIHSMESRIQECPGFSYMGRIVDSQKASKITYRIVEFFNIFFLVFFLFLYCFIICLFLYRNLSLTAVATCRCEPLTEQLKREG